MNTIALVLIVVLQAGTESTKLSAIEKLFVAVEEGGVCEKRNAFNQVHRLGKQAIPSLVERIGTNRKVLTIDLKDPAVSYIHPGELDNNFVGTWALFAIDAVMSREPEQKVLWRKEVEACDFLFGADRTKYRPSAVLLKDGGEPLTHRDMLEIERLYRLWWEKNKAKSLPQMQADWKNGNRPLNGSTYHW
jgi:hypothetical protein